MNENINMGLSPEEKKRQQEKEDEEFLADYFARHPEVVIAPENRREAEPEIAEFKEMIATFEARHSLVELHNIVDLSPELNTVFEFAKVLSLTPEERIASLVLIALKEPEYAKKQMEKIAVAKAIVLTPEDKKMYEIRIAAKEDIILISTKLDVIEKETNISKDKHEELKAEYKRLSKAIGIINKNKVDHNR